MMIRLFKGWQCLIALCCVLIGLCSCGKDGGPEKLESREEDKASPRIAKHSNIENKELSGRDPVFRLFLPTDNREIYGDPSKFYMYTNRTFEGVSSKPWQGGQYGFVRNQLRTKIGMVYTRLHEGMDIRPVRRDSNGEPLDDVRSIADGTVVYTNSSAQASNYGKYVVVRHDWPEGAFYSLYAHLMTADAKPGQKVTAGARLGRLGYTGSGIDKERAHVHVELNFLLSERFQTWYDQHFTSRNAHGIHNGINMTGIDVARLFLELRKNRNLTMREFLNTEKPYFTVKAPGSKIPGILKRYPFLGFEMENAGKAKSWEIIFARSGVPLLFTPSTSSLKYPAVTSVRPVNTNHSYLTMGRLSGSGNKATLSARGSRYIQLLSESF